MCSFILHGNGIDAKILGPLVQIVFAIIVAFGGVMCILPLFTQIFSKSGVECSKSCMSYS